MGLAPRLAFAALAAILLYGFWEARLFSQYIWTPTGIRRLLYVTLVHWTIAALVIWRNPRWRAPVIDWLEIPLGAAVLATAFGLAAHLPLNYWFVWAPIVLVCVAALFRSRQIRVIDMTRMEWAAFALAAFPLLLHLLAALSPESSGDGLAMHLVVPDWIAFHHSWSFDAARLAWAVMPMNGDWLASIAYLIGGGEISAKVLNWIWLAVIAAGLFRALRFTLTRAWAWLGVALFVSTPVVLLVTGSLLVENLWALFLFAGFIALWEDRILASAVLLGAAMGTKFGSLAMILVLLPFVFWRLRKKSAAGHFSVDRRVCGVRLRPLCDGLSHHRKSGVPVL